MMVFVGRRLCDEKYVGGPACEFDCPKEPNTLAGLEAECEVRCEKLRADEVAKAAASGEVLDVASDREVLSKLEPVEAISRVRDAIVRFGASGGDDETRSSKKFHLHRRTAAQRADLDINDIITCFPTWTIFPTYNVISSF
jgi:hypothetical protein